MKILILYILLLFLTYNFRLCFCVGILVSVQSVSSPIVVDGTVEVNVGSSPELTRCFILMYCAAGQITNN